jgi:hypothetical protein
MSYHILGSQISLKIQRSGSTSSQILHPPSAIGDFSELGHLASNVSRHNAMAYDSIDSSNINITTSHAKLLSSMLGTAWAVASGCPNQAHASSSMVWG